jgi:hypothetical protein
MGDKVVNVLDLALGLLLLAGKEALENYIVIITLIVYFWSNWGNPKYAFDVANRTIIAEDLIDDGITVKLLANTFRYVGALIDLARQIRSSIEAILVYLLLSALK